MSTPTCDMHAWQAYRVAWPRPQALVHNDMLGLQHSQHSIDLCSLSNCPEGLVTLLVYSEIIRPIALLLFSQFMHLLNIVDYGGCPEHDS